MVVHTLHFARPKPAGFLFLTDLTIQGLEREAMFKAFIRLQCLRLAVAAGVPPENMLKLAKDFHAWVAE